MLSGLHNRKKEYFCW